MSLVGPRPALFNQHDLIELRTNLKVHKFKTGNCWMGPSEWQR